MGNKPFTMIAVLIFALMAVLHVYRLVKHFPIMIGSHEIPEMASIVGALVTGLLAVMVYRESRR